MGDGIMIDGKRYRVVYQAVGSFISADGEREIRGVGFLGVSPE